MTRLRQEATPRQARLTATQKRALENLPLYRRRNGWGRSGIKISLDTGRKLQALGLAKSTDGRLVACGEAGGRSKFPPKDGENPPVAPWWMRD